MLSGSLKLCPFWGVRGHKIRVWFQELFPVNTHCSVFVFSAASFDTKETYAGRHFRHNTQRSPVISRIQINQSLFGDSQEFVIWTTPCSYCQKTPHNLKCSIYNVQQWFSPWPAVCEESTWQPKCVSVAVTDESETPKFRLSSRRSVSCRLSSVWQLFTRSDSEAKVAQWYVYWEALDNRKGGGCCRNVTTIDKKRTQKIKMDRKTRILTRAGTRAPQTNLGKELTAMHRTRR